MQSFLWLKYLESIFFVPLLSLSMLRFAYEYISSKSDLNVLCCWPNYYQIMIQIMVSERNFYVKPDLSLNWMVLHNWKMFLPSLYPCLCISCSTLLKNKNQTYELRWCHFKRKIEFHLVSNKSCTFTFWNEFSIWRILTRNATRFNS